MANREAKSFKPLTISAEKLPASMARHEEQTSYAAERARLLWEGLDQSCRLHQRLKERRDRMGDLQQRIKRAVHYIAEREEEIRRRSEELIRAFAQGDTACIDRVRSAATCVQPLPSRELGDVREAPPRKPDEITASSARRVKPS